MADRKHLERLREGAESWNDWRQANSNLTPDLTEANLINAQLERAVLDGCDLRGADLSKAQLSHASLHGANLDSATLILGDLLGASLNEANLSGASFFGAFLFGTRLKSARLRGANLLGATLMGADLTGADLTSAHLMSANFHEANLSHADLSMADLTAASLVGTRVEGATFSSCLVHGIAAWRLEGKPRVQSRLILSAKDEVPIMTSDLESAQLANLILYGDRMSHALGGTRLKVCLVLGRFRGSRGDIVDSLADELQGKLYMPMFVDLERPGSRNLEALLSRLGAVAALSIVDTTGLRSIDPIREVMQTTGSPLLPIRRQNEPAAAFAGEGVMDGIEYRDTEDLIGKLRSAAI